MKIVVSFEHKKKIKNALRKISRNNIRTPSDGSMFCLHDSYTKDGKWQVEFVHDKRVFKYPFIAAFFFRNTSNSNLADTVMYKEIK